MSYPAIPITYPDDTQHRRVIAEKVNQINQAKFNCFIDFTLTHDADSSLLKDARLGAYSFLGFMPMTANAAAELTALYIPQATMVNGQAEVFHSNSATTDRSYRVGILG